MAIGPDALKTTAEHLRKIRNTCRFLLANTADFSLAEDAVQYEDMTQVGAVFLLYG